MSQQMTATPSAKAVELVEDLRLAAFVQMATDEAAKLLDYIASLEAQVSAPRPMEGSEREARDIWRLFAYAAAAALEDYAEFEDPDGLAGIIGEMRGKIENLQSALMAEGHSADCALVHAASVDCSCGSSREKEREACPLVEAAQAVRVANAALAKFIGVVDHDQRFAEHSAAIKHLIEVILDREVPDAVSLGASREKEREARADTNDRRASDYRSGYSAGYAHAKAGEAMEDEASAALYLNQPVWEVSVPYYDLAGDDELCHHDTLIVDAEQDAAERAENELRTRIPSAHILFERTEVKPYAGVALGASREKRSA